MTSAPKDPQPVSSLPEDERAAVLERLGVLMADIAAAAAEKAASPKQEDQRWAALLSAIQTVPASLNLDDILFAVDGQPVLVQWGTRDENATVTSAILQDKIATALQQKPLPPVGTVQPGPAAVGAMAGQAVAAPGRGWGWLVALLLWLLFLALLAAIYWWLLIGCAIAPPFGPRIGSCQPVAEAAPSVTASDRRAALEDELAFLRQQLSQAPQCPVETTLLPPRTPAPVPTPVPETDHATVTPPAVEPPANEDATDFDRAREQAGGQTGDVTVTLLWNGHTDLDLSIRCPDGQRLQARNLMPGNQASVCGGEIDVDANLCRKLSTEPGRGRACLEYGEPPQVNPVENAFFVTDRAPPGRYTVLVHHYAADSRDPAATIPFAVQVRQGGEARIVQGKVRNGEMVSVTEFVIE